MAKILYDEYIRNISPAIAPQNLSNGLICCDHFISRCQVDLVHIDGTVREKAMCTLRHLQYKISRIACTSQTDMDTCQRLMILLRMVLKSQNSPGARCSTPITYPNVTSVVHANTSSAQNTHKHTNT